MRKTRKLLAILLCLAMCFSLLPTWAFAEEADLQEQEEPAVAEAVAEEAEEQQEEDSSEADAKDIPTDPAEEISEPAEDPEEEAEIEVAGAPDEGETGYRYFTVDVTTETTIFIALLGDVDLNGEVTRTDATKFSRYIAEWDGYTVNELTADINNDGKVERTDATRLSRFIAEWDEMLEYFKW